MLQLSKTNKGRENTVQKVPRKASKDQWHSDNLRQDLIDRIELCQAKEAEWLHKGNELKTHYKKLYGND